MQAHGKLNHLVSGNTLALIFGVGQAGVGQIERAVYLLRSHRGKRRGDYQELVAHLLEDALRVQFVALFFDVAEIGGVGAAVFQAGLMRSQLNVIFRNAAWDIVLTAQCHGLRHGLAPQQCVKVRRAAKGIGAAVQHAVFNFPAKPLNGQFTHTIYNKVRPAVAKNAGAQALLPIVVVGHAAQRCLYAAEHYGHVGKELL